MKKFNNYHHKTSSDFISKQKTKNEMTSSAVIFKTNVINIKINSPKEGYILLPNSKISNGRSFDKKLQDNKNIIIKNEKTKIDSEKEEIENKEEISTNNLTETIQYNNDMNMNLKGHYINSSNNNYNNYINNYINKKIFAINNKNNTNINYIPTISINIKKNNNRNRIKANIDAKNKSKNKKCLYINNSKIIKKNNNNSNSNNNISNSNTNVNESNDTFNNKMSKKHIRNSYNKERKKFNIQNKDLQKTKRKLPNLTEDNLNNARLPSKSKTQNYLNNNININQSQNQNFFSIRKIIVNGNIINDNNKNNEKNNIKILINSKKKLFIKNKDNNEFKESKNIKENKEKSNKNNKDKNTERNKKLKQNNVLLLKSISVAQKLIRTKSPINKNTITLNNPNYYKNSNTATQDLIDKDFYTLKINTDRSKEDSNNSEQNLISSIKINNTDNKFLNKTQKDKKLSKTSQKYSSKKKNKKKKIDNKKLNKDINTNKKKKISQNNIINNSNNKNIKNDNSFDENILLKNSKDNQNISSQNTTNPIINKVLVFKVDSNKMLNNINNNTDNQKKGYNLRNLNNFNNSNNNSNKNIINFENKINKNINSTPKKNIITEIIRKNIEYNKENKNYELMDLKNSISSFVNDSYFGENISTPVDHKHAFNRNKKYFENKETEKRRMTKNNTNKLSDYKNNTNFKINKQTDNYKNINDMDTPPNILNTPKLTRRIMEAKINLFEKVKNINFENGIFNNIQNNKNLNNRYKEDNSTETDEILYEETSIPSNKKSSKNKKYKINIKNKFKCNNNIENILFLDEGCLLSIFKFFDISMIYSFSLLNKKYYNCIKFIIHKNIKNKVLQFYEKNNTYNNKIKLSLMKFSSLSKLSPLLLHKKYIDLLFEKDNQYDKEIKKDLTRTFPDNFTFKYGNINYNKLYHLLTVYSLYNKKIGYAQGINFLVAHIIILFDKEEDSFVFLDGLLQKFEFEKLLGLQNELANILRNIGLYINKYCPEICKYLDSMNLSHEFFTTNWMLTLFSNSMDNKHLFIIWDFLIIFGWKFFRCFTVSILNIYKDYILDEEQNKLTFFMKNILRNDIFEKNFQDILNKTFKLLNKDNEIN